MSIKRVAIGLGTWSPLFTGIIHKKVGSIVWSLSHGVIESKSGELIAPAYAEASAGKQDSKQGSYF